VKVTILTIGLIVLILLNSCAAVLVGGLIWKSSKSHSEKAEFLEQLRTINLEREKAGLEPLDECIQMYHFDPGWAERNAHCRNKIDSLLAVGVQPDSTKVFQEYGGSQ